MKLRLPAKQDVRSVRSRQFTLRAVAILTLGICLLLALYANELHRFNIESEHFRLANQSGITASRDFGTDVGLDSEGDGPKWDYGCIWQGRLFHPVTRLRIVSKQLSQEDIVHIKAFRSLKTFDCRRCKFDLPLLLAQSWPNLQEIAISEVALSKNDVHEIATLSCLKSLKLHRCGLTDADITQICRLRTLERLQITENGISRKAWKSIRTLAQLRTFLLSGQSSSPAGSDLRTISRLANVLLLNVELSNQDVVEICHLSDLEQLDIRGTTVDDDVVPAIRTLTKLLIVNVENTRLSASGRRAVYDHCKAIRRAVGL